MSVPHTALSGFPARQRLFELGVTEAILREAARIGYSHAAGCTSHDPRNLPGTLAWGKGTGALRDLLKPSGWKADSDSNLESVAHPTNSHAFALAAGTSDTGCEDGRPRTRTPKGPATSRVVKRNAQLSFQGADPAFGDERVEDEQRVTWLLLHYYDVENEEIRLELSCPDEMNGKQVTGWSERLILPPVPFSTDVDFSDDDEDDGQIDVDITRRPS